MRIDRIISARSRGIDASGIRRVFDLGARLKNPVNLSIGQPDFPVPDAVKAAAMEAISGNRNGYTVTQGIEPLRQRLSAHLRSDLGWQVAQGPESPADAPGLLVTSGTSGGLWLALLAVTDPGDEIVIPDPYFVLYPHLCRAVSAVPVGCDTYPDFRLTAARVEPLLTARTKAVVVNSPSNPAGVVLNGRECAELLDLCRRRGVLLISDEIYDEFTFSDGREPIVAGSTGIQGGARCPSPARFEGAHEDVLLIRGFGKTYGVTGWRLGYAAGPRRLLEEMTKLQQYTFVCAPSPLQYGAAAALDVDMGPQIAAYERRRNMVVDRLGRCTEVAVPRGAFYAFPKVPASLGLTGAAFIDRCIERNLLAIPGGVFSERDTHFRLSFATNEDALSRGLDILIDLMRA